MNTAVKRIKPNNESLTPKIYKRSFQDLNAPSFTPPFTPPFFTKPNTTKESINEPIQQNLWEICSTPEELVFYILKSNKNTFTKQQVLEKLIKMTNIGFETECSYIT